MNEDGVSQSDEISLLDLAVVIAESWILLVVGPLVVAAGVFAFSVVQPAPLRSEALLAIPPSEASQFSDRQFVSDATDDTVAADIVEGLSITAGGNDTQSRISLTLAESDNPQARLQSLISAFQEQHYTPIIEVEAEQRQEERDRIEARLAAVDASTTRINAIIDRIESQSPLDGSAIADLFSTLSQLEEEASLYAENLEQINAQASGDEASNTLVVSEPTPNIQVSGRSPLLIAVLAGLGAGFVLLVFVFIRNGLRTGNSDPVTRDKLNRIRKAFFVAPRA